MAKMEIVIKAKEMDIFIDIKMILEKLYSDERIKPEIREEYKAMIKDICKKGEEDEREDG